MSEPQKLGVISFALRQVPNIIVVAGLAGIAFWGVKYDWKLPGTGSAKDAADSWCSNHNVEKAICVTCNPELYPRREAFGWCRKHGVHECTLCHPEVAQLDVPYPVTEADLALANNALTFAPRPDNGRKDKLHERLIQFNNLDVYDRSGVEVTPVWRGKIAESAKVHGEITHDPGRVAHVSPRSAGAVWRVFKHLGDPVEKGELLAIVEAGAVGQAKADYLHWRAQLDSRIVAHARLKNAGSPESTVATADANVREARIKLASSRQAIINLGLPLVADDYQGHSDIEAADRLQFLGLSAEAVAGVDRRAASNNLLPIVSPIKGTITSRDVVAGEVVDSTKLLFEVIDNSVVWLTVGIRNEDVGRVRTGTSKIEFEPDGIPDGITGVVHWIANEADHKTRTIKVRSAIPNPTGKLRANTFGHGEVILREEPQAILVPNDAVHIEGGNRYLFVRDRAFHSEKSPKLFHVRTVRIGAIDHNNTEIIAGVLPGELVATKNSSQLMTELLRGKIGEG